MSLTSSSFRLSPRPSHAGYDPKKDMGYVEIHHCERQEFKKIALRQPIAVVA